MLAQETHTMPMTANAAATRAQFAILSSINLNLSCNSTLHRKRVLRQEKTAPLGRFRYKFTGLLFLVSAIFLIGIVVVCLKGVAHQLDTLVIEDFLISF